jgi:hypothetical protein
MEKHYHNSRWGYYSSPLPYLVPVAVKKRPLFFSVKKKNRQRAGLDLDESWDRTYSTVQYVLCIR